MSNGLKKTGLWRAPRYTDTRVDEVFAVKKPRFKIASGKENAKVTILFARLMAHLVYSINIFIKSLIPRC